MLRAQTVDSGFYWVSGKKKTHSDYSCLYYYLIFSKKKKQLDLAFNYTCLSEHSKHSNIWGK